MMKVGILTFSAAHNFGAILQCYGLYKSLQALGYDVEVIDYRPEYLRSYEPTFGIRQILSRHINTLKSRWRNYRYWRSIYDGYMDFKNDEMRISQPIYDKQGVISIFDRYDKVVIGSDQVWNTRFNGNDDVWYGANINSDKLIAYAASAGNANIWKDTTENLAEKLNHFSHISVREDDLKPIVDDLSANISKVVVDPSLLVDPNVWNKWQEPIINEKYILVYQARECDDVFRIAEELSRQTGASQIIPIDFYGNVKSLGYSTKIASPGEFISLVKNAKCVVTTSFHGTAFSIILHTPFYTLRLNDGADSRAENLLKKLGLSERMIENISTPKFTNINFSESDMRLASLREDSLEYLKRSLQS